VRRTCWQAGQCYLPCRDRRSRRGRAPSVWLGSQSE
jgi:hypothetical protein